MSSFVAAYFNGQARDIHGRPIGGEYQPGHFRGQAIDPRDRPRFESEASHLLRHELLRPAEARALPPSAFDRVTLDLT